MVIKYHYRVRVQGAIFILITLVKAAEHVGFSIAVLRPVLLAKFLVAT
jgi:hypothetical protein